MNSLFHNSFRFYWGIQQNRKTPPHTLLLSHIQKATVKNSPALRRLTPPLCIVKHSSAAFFQVLRSPPLDFLFSHTPWSLACAFPLFYRCVLNKNNMSQQKKADVSPRRTHMHKRDADPRHHRAVKLIFCPPLKTLFYMA